MLSMTMQTLSSHNQHVTHSIYPILFPGATIVNKGLRRRHQKAGFKVQHGQKVIPT